jgi:pyridoxamine 5'-phosphate oxidase family protein
MTEISAAHIEYLAGQRLGRLATAGADHKPHVADTKKYRDVQANGWAAIVIDDLVSMDPWTPRFLEIRGRAEAIPTGGTHLGPGFGDAFIRIHPERVNSFGIA